MSIVEDFTQISQTISNMMDAVTQYDEIEPDLRAFIDQNEYYSDSTIAEAGAEVLLNFVLTGRVCADKKKFCDYYIEKNPQISPDEKELLSALSKSMTTFFEIKKMLRNNFLLYNLTNEIEYNVFPLVKMTHFRGLYAGLYMLATIVNYKDKCFLISIKETYSRSEQEIVGKMAIASMIANPEIAYIDNKEKENKLAEIVQTTRQKFLDCFGCDEILTSGEDADILIELFDNYCHEKISKEECQNVFSKISQPTEYKFFDINDYNVETDNFIEKSLGGFAEQEKQYDVGIIFDEELGLFVIPFWGTFQKIFELENYSAIEGYKECLNNFLQNNAIPHNIIYRAFKRFPDFMKIVNEILEKNYTIDELIKIYKYKFIDKKIFSSTAVLYNSELFNSILSCIATDVIPEDEETADIPAVGRNDLCPCGSGKKYKKCCMNKNQNQN